MVKSKLQLLLWCEGNPASLHTGLIELAPELQRRTGADVQVNLADAAVQPAADKRMAASGPLPDGLLSLWGDTDQSTALLAMIEEPLPDGTSRAVYRVEEAEPLADTQHDLDDGQRTPGFSQVALLQCPDFLSYAQWLDYWKAVHTPLAIETQATFRYLQNRVVEVLEGDRGDVAAIVEECFPTEAMTDPRVFYDARGDEARFQANSTRMMESCAKFIDFARIDVVPTSEYRWGQR